MFSCMLKTEKRDLAKCDLVIVTRHFRASKHKIVRRKNQQKFPRKRLDLKSNFAPILSYLNLVTNNWDKNSYHCA